MVEEQRRKSTLGRGLAALLDDDTIETPPAAAVEQSRLRDLPVDQIQPGRFQPRTVFDAQALDDLTASIREKGVLQPIVVRRTPDPNRYELIAGERRWRAAQRAQLHVIPALVQDLTDNEALEIALIENVQRQDLDAVEEALGYKRLMDEFGHTQEKVAQMVGKGRVVIANRLRLLNLPADVLDLLRVGRLSEGHARALLGASDPSALAAQAVAGDWTVRQTEQAAQAAPRNTPKPGRSTTPSGATKGSAKDADTLALERSLTMALGLKVGIDHSGTGGRVSIAYGSLEQLDALCRLLSHGLGGEGTADEEPLDPAEEAMLRARELANLKPAGPGESQI